jgi:hypothetical protein
LKKRLFMTKILIFFSLICMLLINSTSAQQAFRKPGKKTRNQLTQDGTYLKTMFSFETDRFDTVQQPGQEPELVHTYKNDDIIQGIVQPVLEGKVNVFKANYWGGIPQFLDKTNFDLMDTAQILYQFNAGWDTSYIIETDGSMQSLPVYRQVKFGEVSGLFFFESWWLDAKDLRFYKDVIAYQPIREYQAFSQDNPESTEMLKRLVFMVVPELPIEPPKKKKYRLKNFKSLRLNHTYEMNLYNRSYDKYIFREELQTGVRKQEFEEWQYHHFDFYKYFDRENFLIQIIKGILEGKLTVCHPGTERNVMDRAEFIKLLHDIPEGAEYAPQKTITPEQYPLDELNSMVFQEDWYVNQDNLQIYKDVKQLTINRHNRVYDNYTEEFIRETKDPLFTVWF